MCELPAPWPHREFTDASGAIRVQHDPAAAVRTHGNASAGHRHGEVWGGLVGGRPAVQHGLRLSLNLVQLEGQALVVRGEHQRAPLGGGLVAPHRAASGVGSQLLQVGEGIVRNSLFGGGGHY